MLNRNLKAAYYALAHYPMRANALRHRLFSANRQPLRVHLGPGRGNYLDGWVNVDANLLTAKSDMWADVGQKLPFRSGSVVAFYSHHVIEHLPDRRLATHFSEMFRCLRPGGAIRIGCPDAENAAKKLLENDGAWFFDFPDNRLSVGGRFANFILCRGEHVSIITKSYLDELATGAGFAPTVRRRPCVETGFPDLFDKAVLATEWEPTPDVPHTLIVETAKMLESP